MRKTASKTPALINEEGKNISNEIVGGEPYPSCMACVKAGVSCHWKQGVIHLRLALLPNKAKNCEECIRKQVACQFIWENDKSLKRMAEEAQEPESSKRVKTDPSDILSCLQSIDKHIGTLVKFTVAQVHKAGKEHEATSDMFEVIKDSLDILHQKYNDN